MANIVKIGNTEFNKDSFQEMTKEEFVNMYKGKLMVDLDEAWKLLKPSVRVKKPKAKKA